MSEVPSLLYADADIGACHDPELRELFSGLQVTLLLLSLGLLPFVVCYVFLSVTNLVPKYVIGLYEDLDELLTLSDRLLVMHSGKIVGEFDPVNSERHDIGAAMAGEAQT